MAIPPICEKTEEIRPYFRSMKQLLNIAKELSYTVEMRGDLESRMNDEEDFIDIAVWTLQEMLERAYQLGLSDARK